MKKTGKKDTLNLVFSAFLILGYIVCSYFFLSFGATTGFAPYISLLVFIVFGLIVFYATRVGEGTAVKRFSLWTLIILDIPALYIILASFIQVLPFHNAITTLGGDIPLTYSPLFILACIALGYGIPYTFLSGFETKLDEEVAEELSEEVSEEEAPCCGDCTACDGCEETEETDRQTSEEAAEVTEETENAQTEE